MKLTSQIGNVFKAGFTLLEIMLVVMIIALLAGIAIVKYGNVFNTASEAAARAQISDFKIGLLTYRTKAGFYPTTEQGLQALIVKPTTEPVPRNWMSVLEKPLPKDPWGNDYFYLEPGKHNPDGYDLFSAGIDRKPGTGDDIGNWRES